MSRGDDPQDTGSAAPTRRRESITPPTPSSQLTTRPKVDPAIAEPGDLIGDRFVVVRKLGAGGMGVVYEVEHLVTKHRRALKLLLARAEVDDAMKRRLLLEASAAGRIGNPHIVETYDGGALPGGEIYVVMELLVGEGFDTILKRERRIELDRLADLVIQTCDGLQAAHDAGIVHRDVKPANLFLTERNGRPFVKVLDFGISKFHHDDGAELTRENAMLGTPAYMAPEQIRGAKEVDGRADVYALGIILYAAAAGRRPFSGSSLPELVLKVDRGECTPLAELRPDLPKEFVAIVERAMHAERDLRFQSPAALASALGHFMDGFAQGSAPANGPPRAEPDVVPLEQLLEPVAPVAAVNPFGPAAPVVEPQPAPEAKANSSVARNALVAALIAAVVLAVGAGLAFSFGRGPKTEPPTTTNAPPKPTASATALAAPSPLPVATSAPPPASQTAPASQSAPIAPAPSPTTKPAAAPKSPSTKDTGGLQRDNPY